MCIRLYIGLGILNTGDESRKTFHYTATATALYILARFRRFFAIYEQLVYSSHSIAA